MNSLSIIFDNDGAYYPGDTVTGKVVFNNPKPLKARSIWIFCEGISQTNVKRIFGIPYKKSVLSKDLILWVPKSEEEHLPADTHEFQFSFKLPEDCPPTINLCNVKNQYKVKVVVDRPWKKNLKTEAEFVVTKKLDVQGPRLVRYRETFNAGFFVNSGPITLNVTLPTVVKPGQTIDITYKIINNSSVTVNLLNADLHSLAHCHAREQHTPCKMYEECPLSYSQQGYRGRSFGKTKTEKVDIAPYTEGTYQMPFTISEKATTPSFETGLMTFYYYLWVGVEVKGSVMGGGGFQVPMIVGDAKEEEKTPPKTIESAAPPPYSA